MYDSTIFNCYINEIGDPKIQEIVDVWGHQFSGPERFQQSFSSRRNPLASRGCSTCWL